MPVYTVHEPPPKGAETEPNPERFVFVRDGFAFWAFLLGPLWMLRYRLWLVLVLYVVVLVSVQVGLSLAGASGFVRSSVGLLLMLLIGFEATTLRRWTLTRRRWRNVGVVVADDVETAERRFFDAWVQERGEPVAPPPPSRGSAAPIMRMTPRSTDVVGLFPEPGASR